MDAHRSRSTMRARRAIASRSALVLTACAGLGLSACADEKSAGATGATTPAPRPSRPELVGRWTPASAPAFITIEQDTSVALAEGDADLLLLVTEKAETRRSPAVSRVTWILEIPSDAIPEDRFAFLGDGSGSAPRGWVIERASTGAGAMRIGLGGFITVLERDEDSMLVDLKLFPIDAPETPDLLEQVVFRLVDRPQAAATPALDTRSGVALKAREGPPDRRPTDSVWPFGEIAGEYPPVKHGDNSLHPQ